MDKIVKFCRDNILAVLLGESLSLLCACASSENMAQRSVWFFFFSILAMAAISDIQTRKISDRYCIAVLMLFLPALFLLPEITVGERLCGAVCTSMPMLFLAVLFPGGIGGGDIKLTAVCGLLLGWRRMAVSLIVAILSGGLFGAVLLLTGKKGRQGHLAFAPFLALGMAVGVMFGSRLIAWYFS